MMWYTVLSTQSNIPLGDYSTAQWQLFGSYFQHCFVGHCFSVHRFFRGLEEKVGGLNQLKLECKIFV